MQTLLGLLAITGRVMPMSRIFSRRLYIATSVLKSPYSHIRLTCFLKMDMMVWSNFLESFNARAFFRRVLWMLMLCSCSQMRQGCMDLQPYETCVGVVEAGWNPELSKKIPGILSYWSFFPEVVVVKLWGSEFANKRILLHTDNKSVLYTVNCLSSKSLFVIQILWHLVFMCLKFNIWLKAKFVPDKCNILADSLSRFQFREFLQSADPVCHACPAHLWVLI